MATFQNTETLEEVVIPDDLLQELLAHQAKLTSAAINKQILPILIVGGAILGISIGIHISHYLDKKKEEKKNQK